MFKKLKARISLIEERLNGIEERLNGIEKRLNGIEKRLNCLHTDTEFEQILFMIDDKDWREKCENCGQGIGPRITEKEKLEKENKKMEEKLDQNKTRTQVLEMSIEKQSMDEEIEEKESFPIDREKVLAVENIKNKILADLTDRRGFRGQWESTDNDVRKEIEEAWLNIIRNEINLYF